jgi:signal transduction histidine kinase
LTAGQRAQRRLRVEALMRDVSERKKLDDETRISTTSSCRRENGRAGTTISGVAHELNNPLATILSWSDACPRPITDASLRHGLDTILESERAARIVHNLLGRAQARTSEIMVT